MTNVRWTVVALLFFAITINYAVPFAIAATTYSVALLLCPSSARQRARECL
jgi:hypothetical protein